MEYKLYKLKFDTPVHFGSDKLAVSLEESDFICHSDTLFSALCQSGTERLSAHLRLACSGCLIVIHAASVLCLEKATDGHAALRLYPLKPSS